MLKMIVIYMYFRSWGSRFVAAADKIMIQGQPVWNSPYFCDTQADTICTLFSDTVANVKAVAFWEEIVCIFVSCHQIFTADPFVFH